MRVESHSAAGSFVGPKPHGLEDHFHEMKARQPGQKHEEDQVGADHLGLLRPREGRPEGDAEGRGGDVDAQNLSRPKSSAPAA